MGVRAAVEEGPLLDGPCVVPVCDRRRARAHLGELRAVARGCGVALVPGSSSPSVLRGFAACRSSVPRRAWGRRSSVRAPCLRLSTATERDVPLGDIATLNATAPIFVAILSILLPREAMEARARHNAACVRRDPRLVQPTFSASRHVVAIMLFARFRRPSRIFLRTVSRASPESIVFHFAVVSVSRRRRSRSSPGRHHRWQVVSRSRSGASRSGSANSP